MMFSDLGSLLRGPPRSHSHCRHRILLSHVSTATTELRSAPAQQSRPKEFRYFARSKRIRCAFFALYAFRWWFNSPLK
ncbi:hypothetical protein ACFX2K_027331 [Malus domestica]